MERILGVGCDGDTLVFSGSAGRLGGGKKDISMLFTYSAMDNYLSEGGRIGFVITQSVFKTQGAGDGFRRFDYEVKGTKWHILPLGVHDLSDFKPFDGAKNNTAVLIASKRMPAFSYPVPYTMWKNCFRITVARDKDSDDTYETDSPTRSRFNKNISLAYSAEAGAFRDSKSDRGQRLSGVRRLLYVAERCVLDQRRGNTLERQLLIENLYDEGKLKVKHVQAVIEPDLVYPLLRGKDVRR